MPSPHFLGEIHNIPKLPLTPFLVMPGMNPHLDYSITWHHLHLSQYLIRPPRIHIIRTHIKISGITEIASQIPSEILIQPIHRRFHRWFVDEHILHRPHPLYRFAANSQLLHRIHKCRKLMQMPVTVQMTHRHTRLPHLVNLRLRLRYNILLTNSQCQCLLSHVIRRKKTPLPSTNDAILPGSDTGLSPSTYVRCTP